MERTAGPPKKIPQKLAPYLRYSDMGLFVSGPLYHQMDGLIVKTDNLEGELALVGRDGLIVIDLGHQDKRTVLVVDGIPLCQITK